MEAKELARLTAELALSKKAMDVVILDLTGLSDATNFFVICTGETDTQVKAITDAISDGTREQGAKVWRREGLSNLQWTLLDYVDVVVHVFQPKVRQYYDIERLWGDAPRTVVRD